MLFERIVSAGLAHFSYLVGQDGKAVVIDPRRDCEIYIKKAADAGCRITAILETHRNEDYCIGSVELAARTGAEIWHADPQLDYRYGKPVKDGQEWTIGTLRIRAMSTPGHTPGSVSYILINSSGVPWMVFTGDTLFAGDVGRTDLLGKEKTEELSGLLYDSLFEKILPLGDGTILCPAHGPGSACGTAIADRPWTTVGLERQLNPLLQHTDKQAFVISTANMRERPPYFLRMEKFNTEGAPLMGSVPVLAPLQPREFGEAAGSGIIVDIRSEAAFGASHIPGSLYLWSGGLASYAGWFLPYGKPLLLVGEGNDFEAAVRTFVRMGYDNLAGYLAGGMTAWHRAGNPGGSVRIITVQELCGILDAMGDPFILDVRSSEELERDGQIPGSCHIHVTRLPENLHQLPKDRDIFIFCASGLRSMVAAGLLLREGFSGITVILGGFAGWTSVTCPIQKSRYSNG